MQFRFVIVVPKYLNFSTFSKNLLAVFINYVQDGVPFFLWLNADEGANLLSRISEMLRWYGMNVMPLEVLRPSYFSLPSLVPTLCLVCGPPYSMGSLNCVSW